MSNTPTTTEEKRKAERRQGDRRVINIAVSYDRRTGSDRRGGDRRAV
ncbi:MAG TPA: hypothetical protein VMF61_09715 [Candidatus Acidoferrales bacterium]|nr:hypothetical protein [Candidatus Acidoferrales bacterium]